MLKKIMMFLVATNIIASPTSERQLTGTPTARANVKQITPTKQLNYNVNS